jgi:hypothetical protein
MFQKRKRLRSLVHINDDDGHHTWFGSIIGFIEQLELVTIKSHKNLTNLQTLSLSLTSLVVARLTQASLGYGC